MLRTFLTTRVITRLLAFREGIDGENNPTIVQSFFFCTQNDSSGSPLPIALEQKRSFVLFWTVRKNHAPACVS